MSYVSKVPGLDLRRGSEIVFTDFHDVVYFCEELHVGA